MLIALREMIAGKIRIAEQARTVESRIAMYKVANINMAAQKDKKSRLTGTAGLCLELMTRINEMGVPVRWVWLDREKAIREQYDAASARMILLHLVEELGVLTGDDRFSAALDCLRKPADYYL